MKCITASVCICSQSLANLGLQAIKVHVGSPSDFNQQWVNFKSDSSLKTKKKNSRLQDVELQKDSVTSWNKPWLQLKYNMDFDFCPCKVGNTDNLSHHLLFCPQNELLGICLASMIGLSTHFKWISLLRNEDTDVTLRLANLSVYTARCSQDFMARNLANGKADERNVWFELI